MKSTNRIIRPSIPSAGKHIAYDRASGDYAAYYEGRLLGFRKRYDDARALADQHVYDLFLHGGAVSAGELAAGAE